MNTGSTARASGPGQGAESTPRIVRIALGTAPLVAAVAVLCTVWAAVPHHAWLPWAGGSAPADAWQAPLSWPAGALADLQTTVGARVAPEHPIGGAVAVAAALGAANAVVLSIALRAAGLGAGLAALLALVASAAPLAAWQSGSPLGGGPASLVSALVLWRLVRQRVRMHVTWFGRLAAVGTVAVALGVLVASATLLARWQGAPPASSTLALLRGDLGLLGLVLLFPALGRRHSARVPRERVWLGVAALWLLTTPMAPTVRAAVLLPWAWWLVGAGLAQLLAWRRPHATRWAVAGVLVWVALQAAHVPWGHQRQTAALARTWAEALAARIDVAHPLVREGSARERLASAIARRRAGRPDASLVVARTDARAVAREGRRPLVVSTTDRDALRWDGLAIDTLDDEMGAPLERVLDALPRGTIVLAALSAEAAAHVSPAQWQALGRVGLRLADAGTPRAHAIVGVTRARVEALEVAQAGSVRLDTQPGDPLGRTGTRSPVDARLEADATTVRIHLRDRPFLDEHGLAVLFFSTRGDFLGWRAGRTPDRLDGPPLGSGPRLGSVGVEALPCVDVPAGATTDVTTATGSGALGVNWRRPGRIELTLTRPPGVVDQGVRLAGDPKDPSLPRLSSPASAHGAIALASTSSGAHGLYLRGPVAHATATAAVPVRVCAAWPMLQTLAATGGPIEMPVLPRFDAHYADGWHDMEPLGGGGYFRWMAGARATLLLALRDTTALRLVLDAQGVAPPGPDDLVRLIVNGRDLGSRPLHPTRGLYAWEVPTAALRVGLNRVVVETSQTVRPADRRPGADPRVLGLAVYGWRVESLPQSEVPTRPGT